MTIARPRVGKRPMPKPLTHIAFIAGSYPSRSRPYAGVFLQQFIAAVAGRGVRCTVVNPTPVHHGFSNLPMLGKAACPPDDLKPARPVYFPAANRVLGPFRSPRKAQELFTRAALRSLRRLGDAPDALYGHFLYPAGAAAVWLGRRFNRPAFVAVGEGSFWSVKRLGVARCKRDMLGATGFIAVSSLLKRNLHVDFDIPLEKIAVFPNGTDLARFFPRSRAEMRAKLGLPAGTFIVAFVGTFEELKGLDKLQAALAGLEGVGAVFLGSGPMKPAGAHVLYCGRVFHEQVPEFLSAADVFVLPTLEEGSCNALVEAMACGLPIVTSDGEFNNDLVDDSVAIRVDPLDVQAIRRAIVELRDNPLLRQRMAAAALQRAPQFDINVRAARICQWMEARVSENH